MDKLQKRIAHKRKKRRARIVDAFARERYILASDFSAQKFLDDDDFKNHRISKKHEKITSWKIFARDYFKNQTLQNINKIRIQNQNINTAQKIRGAQFNKKLSKAQKRDAIAYYTNTRRATLDIDKIYIQKSAPKIIDDIDISRVYFKNSATKNNYIVNNLQHDEQKKYKQDIARIQYKKRVQKRKNTVLDKICDNI